MKLLITGGCGFLGSNLAYEALKRSQDLIVLDDLSHSGSEKNLQWLEESGKFKSIKADITDQAAIEEIIKAELPEVIFHLAGQVAMTTSIEDPRRDFEINSLGTFNILEAVRNHCPKCIVIYSSTNKVYGDLEWVKYQETDKRYIALDYPDGFPEDIQLEFSSPYGCSKGCADQYMLDYYRIFNIPTIVFRHSSMFGSRQFSTYDQGWIGWFTKQAMENKEFTISGNGKQVRDVLYADDMISLYFKAIENINQARGEAFNIGGGMKNSLSLLELFDILEKELDTKLNYRKIPVRQSDQKVFVADIKKAALKLNWQPACDKLIGIREMIKWSRSA